MDVSKYKLKPIKQLATKMCLKTHACVCLLTIKLYMCAGVINNGTWMFQSRHSTICLFQVRTLQSIDNTDSTRKQITEIYCSSLAQNTLSNYTSGAVHLIGTSPPWDA